MKPFSTSYIACYWAADIKASGPFCCLVYDLYVIPGLGMRRRTIGKIFVTNQPSMFPIAGWTWGGIPPKEIS